MVANEKMIQIFGYDQNFEPFHIISYNIDQGKMLLPLLDQQSNNDPSVEPSPLAANSPRHIGLLDKKSESSS